ETARASPFARPARFLWASPTARARLRDRAGVVVIVPSRVVQRRDVPGEPRARGPEGTRVLQQLPRTRARDVGGRRLRVVPPGEGGGARYMPKLSRVRIPRSSRARTEDGQRARRVRL